MDAVSDPKPLLVVCTICNKPLKLEDSKIDAAGQPMHEECYVRIVTGKKPTAGVSHPN
jgi:hypothetical protein